MRPTVSPLEGNLQFVEVPDPAPPSKQLLLEIDAIWTRESVAESSRMHDGKIFNLTRFDDGTIEGCFVPYRRWVAQRCEPSLRAKLAITPLAVCALASRQGDVLFGRRSERVLQDPGVWELAPAGGLSAEARNVADQIDPALQLMIELDEELGIKPDRIEHMQPLGFIEDEAEGVREIAFRIELSADAQPRPGDSREYGELALVPAPELKSFLKLVGKVCDSSLALLEFGSGLD